MKRLRNMMILALLAVSVLIPGCSRDEGMIREEQEKPESTMARPGFQKDKELVIAADLDCSLHFNPFTPNTEGEDMILSIIFTTPLTRNSDNELIPWKGNILTDINADGSTSYIVTIDENLFFTDGTPVTIDDYLYSLYAKADPSYKGQDPLTDLDIRGIWNYYYDDDNWEENLGKLRRYCMEHYSLGTISQDDYTAYMVESRLEGGFDSRSIDEWKDILRDEGWTTEADSAHTEEEVLEMVSLLEYADHMSEHDPYRWYLDRLERKYLERNLAGDVHVEEIEGIRKLNSHAARITLDSVTPYTLERLNVQIVPHLYYGQYVKGDISSIAENDIPLGSGPYSFYAVYDDKVILKANGSYPDGIPNIGSITLVRMPEEDIPAALADGTVDIGLLSGNEAQLAFLERDGIRLDMLAIGRYPSIFFSTSLERDDRRKLFSTVSGTVRQLPLPPLEQKVERPFDPLCPEYDIDRRHAGLDEMNRNPVDGGRTIRMLVDDSIPEASIILLQRNLNTALHLIGNSLVVERMPREMLDSEFSGGNADLCMIPSSGSLEEKASMYHSQGSSNIQGIDDPVIDGLLERIWSEPSLDERRKLVGLLYDRMTDEALEIPLFQHRAIIAYNTDTLDGTSIRDGSTASWNFLSWLWSLRKR